MSYRSLQRVSLLAVVAAAFVVAPIATRAAAGVRSDEVACCCPDPSACQCHDHDDDGPRPDAQVRKCGQDGELISPVVVLAVVPAAPPRLPPAPPAQRAPSPRLVPSPADRPIRPVTPPF